MAGRGITQCGLLSTEVSSFSEVTDQQKKGISIITGWDIFEVDFDFSVQLETEYNHI